MRQLIERGWWQVIDTLSDGETTTRRAASPAGGGQKRSRKAEHGTRAADAYGGKVRLRWDAEAAVTAFGQMHYFIEFLKTTELFDDTGRLRASVAKIIKRRPIVNFGLRSRFIPKGIHSLKLNGVSVAY